MNLYINHINLPGEPGNGRANTSLLQYVSVVHLPLSSIIFNGLFEPQDTVLVKVVQIPTLSLDDNSKDVLTSQLSFSSECE